MKTDSDTEWNIIKEASLKAGAFDAVISTHWENGGIGAKKLAERVIDACHQTQNFK